MGDTDLDEFDWNESMSNEELLTLYERNGTMALLCDWIPGEALKNNWTWKTVNGKPRPPPSNPTTPTPTPDEKQPTPPENQPQPAEKEGSVTFTDPKTGEKSTLPYFEFLEQIHFKPKLLRAIAFARLHGSALMVFFNDSPDLDTISEQYYDCEVYHKDCFGNGWSVAEVDDFGNPTVFHIKIQTDEMDFPKEFDVNAERCVVFKNPRKGQCWDGTPSSRMLAHYNQAEELCVKNAVKWVILHAKATAHFRNVTSQGQADRLHTVFNHGQTDELMTNQVEMDWKAPPLQSLGQSLGTFFNILANLQARTIRISRQAMDGAPEGTLSSAQYST